MIKKTRPIKTWIEADFPCKYLTPNWYNALVPVVVYVSNDITISGNFMMSRIETIGTTNTGLRARVNGTKLV